MANANSAEKFAAPSADHEHKPRPAPDDCPHAVASTLMQRHRDNRQRFDSADYEMSGRVAGSCAACTCGKCDAMATKRDVEHEPEPGHEEHRQQLRCLRLQRFDSADWAMQMQLAQRESQPASTAPEHANVAQMLMDRHASKTCSFVGPAPVKNSEPCAETA
ncbi:hypothetical protein BBJ28_00008986 [Nothophytophthora sp. Chile5]|nr:hypothetical protein BBJ28_00008986 [Nothophytophthora sp. Chile5]